MKEDEETVERTMLLTRLLLLWRWLTMTCSFSPTGPRAATTPCLGGGGGGGGGGGPAGGFGRGGGDFFIFAPRAGGRGNPLVGGGGRADSGATR